MSKIVVYRDYGFVKGIISGLIDFGAMFIGVWFNYNFVGGSYFLNGFLLVVFILTISGKLNGMKHTFHDKESAIKYIQNL